MRKENFEKLVNEGLREIPFEFRKKLDNVEIVIEKESRRKNLLGLYQGVPKTKRSHAYSGILPDKITIFQDSIEKKAGDSEDKIRQLVKQVVWHEIAHHFGMEEDEVRKAEAKKFKM